LYDKILLYQYGYSLCVRFFGVVGLLSVFGIGELVNNTYKGL